MSNATLPAVANGQHVAPPLPAAVAINYDAVLAALKLNPRDPNVQALLLTCQRYGLDPVLKHAVLIQGSLYVTRDGLLHVAHASGHFDGMEVIEEAETPTHYKAKVAVYRKDMGRPFAYWGRYPKGGPNKAYGPEMAVKCSEVMGLRRAFDVSLCAAEELWDRDEAPAAPVAYAPAPAIEAPAEPPEPDPARQAVNESFPAPKPAGETFWMFVTNAVREELDGWLAEMAMEGVPDDRRKDTCNHHSIVNFVCTLGLERGVIKQEEVCKLTDPRVRDRERVKARLEQLWRKSPSSIRQHVAEHLQAKRRELRAELGMPDPDAEDEALAPAGKGEAYEGDLADIPGPGDPVADIP